MSKDSSLLAPSQDNQLGFSGQRRSQGGEDAHNIISSCSPIHTPNYVFACTHQGSTKVSERKFIFK